ncbi:CBS domain-containing protein [Candidatus Woesearchaeota archaeon]|nr:CBS domain-containing protein [Candidatus Woesearchaeota archaeon]
MIVKEIMHNADRITSGATVSEAARIMDRKIVGSLLVEEKGKVVGIITERDILRKVVAKGKIPDKLRVKDIMSSPLVTIDANEDILEASSIMDRERIRRLVVTENGIIVGKVTANSISRNLKYYIARKSLISTEYIRPEY